MRAVKAWGSARVATDGSTGNTYNDLDSMLVGNVFLDLAQATGDSRYRLAANRIVKRVATFPRTSDGALIHNVAFTGQLWSDGAFMAQPFLARAGDHAGPPRQLLTYFGHLRNEDALLRHAYDETRRSEWANTTGRSPEVWCRAVGWFGMATVDVLEELPRTHPDRAALVEIVRYLADGYRRWQDPATGRWFQLPVKPGLAGNWTETSCSAMFTYTLARAIERGYVSPAFWPVAQRGYRGVLAKVSIGSDGRTRISDVVIGTNVGADYRTAVRDLVDRAVALGHRGFAYVGPGAGAESSVDRLQGFREAVAAHGVQGVHVQTARLDQLREAGVTAVLTEEVSDGAAIVLAGRARGLSVPGDLVVLSLGAATRPAPDDVALTGFRIPGREMGRRAVQALTEVLEHGTTPQELLPCEFVEGATLGAPRL